MKENVGRRYLQRIRSFFPLKWQIKLEYRIKCGRKLNLNNPQRYSEKLQLYKKNYKNPLLTICADKFAVREYVKKLGLEIILNELYGVYDNVDEIDFSDLPDQFVIKLNTGSGYNIIVPNKKQINIFDVKKTLKKWINIKPWIFGTEWPYKKIRPKIIIEKYLGDNLQNYKFLSFNGKVDYIQMEIETGIGKKISYFDINFTNTGIHRDDYGEIKDDLIKPMNLDKMIEYAGILSREFPHVRVDLYSIEGKIYFGELTFYPRGGYLNFTPDDFDYVLGDKFFLNS